MAGGGAIADRLSSLVSALDASGMKRAEPSTEPVHWPHEADALVWARTSRQRGQLLVA